MKYFIDTEFLEGRQKEKFPINLFRKETPNTIDLISIGIVAEDGREYYAVSKDFNLKEAWNRYQMKQVYGDARNIFHNGIKEYWIRENVLKPIFDEWKRGVNGKILRLGLPIPLNEMQFNYKNFKHCIKCIGKTNKQIAEEIKEFIYSKENILYNHERCSINNVGEVKSKIKFFGYYSDYDWVVFCWLFGKMIDLPKGFTMYCNDLKQMLDEKVTTKKEDWGENATNFDMLNHIKTLPDYPKQENEHNALADARWNKKLYEFLTKIAE